MSKKSSNFAGKIGLKHMQHPNLYIIAGPIKTKYMSERELEAILSIGLKQSYKKVVEQHRRDNQPLIFSENGQVKYVDPFTVAI
jgi:hypothetical protein